MAAFVLTLVPAAAFAAGEVSVQTSAFDIVDADNIALTEKTVTVNGELTGLFDLRSSDEENATQGAAVRIWALEKGQVTDALVVKNGTATVAKADQASTNTGGNVYLVNEAKDNQTVKISFTRPGTYTVYAGTVAPTKPDGSGATKLIKSTECTITVNAAETTVNKINATPSAPLNDVDPNSFNAITVDLTVDGVIAGTTTPAKNFDGKVISIENGNESKGVYVYKTGTETPIEEGVTVNDGKAKFDVKVVNGAIPGTYPIVLSCDDAEEILYVTVNGNNVATSIEVVDTDSQYVNMADPDFTGVTEVIFKDADGNAVTTAPSINASFVTVPEGFDKANAGALSVTSVPNTDKFALTYDDSLTKLKAGKYTVRLGIKDQTSSNAVVELSFNAVKVGDTVALEIDMDNDAETIVSGGKVTGTVYAIDANGIKTAAKRSDVKLGFVNSAAVDLTAGKTDVSLNNANGTFVVYAKDAEKYYGSKITLFAFDEDAKVQATKDLTVVDGMSTNTLAFDKEAGSIAKNNTVKVSIVDENGKVVNAAGYAYAYVESQSNEDAKIDVSFADKQVKNGTINMTVYSDKETTADIVVAVKDSTSKAIYANTLTYTFGEQDIPVDTTVVMTIGSSDFVINDKVVTKEDSAPYVANDRTYVPFRALGEALGAEVVWDNDARTVTYTLGNTEVVMTIGETTYTVNGDEKTMDVAPEITGDRTYVPVRFVGEALGFKVVALSATDGTTSSVVFQK